MRTIEKYLWKKARVVCIKLIYLKCKKNNDNKIFLVDRSIYDSIVYNTVEHNMGTLTEFQYNFLSNIEQKALEIVNPYTVILNPDSKKVVNYLEQRAKRGGREKRNRLCRREDTLEYISMMHDEYSKIACTNVLYLEGGLEENVKETNEWIRKMYI